MSLHFINRISPLLKLQLAALRPLFLETEERADGYSVSCCCLYAAHLHTASDIVLDSAEQRRICSCLLQYSATFKQFNIKK